jgi:hypothetical protein
VNYSQDTLGDWESQYQEFSQKLDKLMRGTTTADKVLAARVVVAGKMS